MTVKAERAHYSPKQWICTRRIPTKEEEKEIAGMVAEIAVRILWENYCYDFRGRTYKQKEGGPIGQRPTMAASRLVMTRLSCFNVKTNCFIFKKIISLVRLKLISSLG